MPVYEFTAEAGPEEFPSLGVVLHEAGERVESAEPIEHPRLREVVPDESQPSKSRPAAEPSTEKEA